MKFNFEVVRMTGSTHHLLLKYGEILDKPYAHIPLILVVGREPNNPNPFQSTIGDYPLEAKRYEEGGKKRTVAFWDQSFGIIGKTSGISCASFKSIVRRVGASPIVFTDVMPTPAEYEEGGQGPRKAREDATEQLIQTHHDSIFSKTEVMDRVSLVVLAGHRHGSFSKLERAKLKYATTAFADRCAHLAKPIPTIETKSMFGNNQRWNLDQIRSNDTASMLMKDAVNCLLEMDVTQSSKTGSQTQ